MFKNQLQELAQRSCFNLPSYGSTREGPDHAPRFKAFVNFNGEIFESPSYSSTLRQAEHSAAEAALNSLSSRGSKYLTARVLDETGVYKNLLQETAHKAGLNLPVYTTVRSGPGHLPVFTCTVELAGLSFHGVPAKTKKQAEKNAAVAAWSSLKKMPRLFSVGKQGSTENDEEEEEEEQVVVTRILSNFTTTPTKNERKIHKVKDSSSSHHGRRKKAGGGRTDHHTNNKNPPPSSSSSSSVSAFDHPSPEFYIQQQKSLLCSTTSDNYHQNKQNITMSSFLDLLPPPPPRTTSKILPLTLSSRHHYSSSSSSSRRYNNGPDSRFQQRRRAPPPPPPTPTSSLLQNTNITTTTPSAEDQNQVTRKSRVTADIHISDDFNEKNPETISAPPLHNDDGDVHKPPLVLIPCPSPTLGLPQPPFSCKDWDHHHKDQQKPQLFRNLIISSSSGLSNGSSWSWYYDSTKESSSNTTVHRRQRCTDTEIDVCYSGGGRFITKGIAPSVQVRSILPVCASPVTAESPSGQVE